MHDRKDSPHKSLQTRNSTSESWAAVWKHPSRRSLFDWSCGSTSGFSRSKTTLLLKGQSRLPSPSNNFSCNTTLAVQHHTRSSRQMKGGEWGRYSFAALHAKVSLCHWWNFPLGNSRYTVILKSLLKNMAKVFWGINKQPWKSYKTQPWKENSCLST